MHETNIKKYKKLTRRPNVWIKSTILPEFKVKIFELSSSSMNNPYQKIFLDIIVLLVKQFK